MYFGILITLLDDFNEIVIITHVGDWDPYS